MTSAVSVSDSAVRLALARRKDYQWRPPAWLAMVAVLGAAATYFVVARSATYPLIPLDEMVMMADSRIIAGDGGAWAMTGGGFMPGLAVLLAPLWWITSDQVVVYQAGIWITVVVALLTIWPLSVLARRVGATREAGVIIASVIMIAPARILVTNFLISETLMTLATALVAAAGIRLYRTRQTRDAVLLGLATGMAVVAHGRGVAIALAVGIWCLMLLRVCARPALIAGLTAVLSSLGAFALYFAVSPASPGSDGRISGSIDNLTATSVGELFASLLGQLWYASLAWPLVLLLGSGLVARHARRKPDMALVLLMAVLAVALSTTQLTHPTDISRIDPWFYGRYNDHVWTLLATIGLALAVRWVWPKVLAIVVGVAGVLAALMFFVTVPNIPNGDGWQSLHVFGVAPWLSLEQLHKGQAQPWALICMLGFALTLALALVALVRAWIVPVLAVGWLALSLTYDANVLDVQNGTRDPDAHRWGFVALPEGVSIGVDASTGDLRNLVIFVSGDRGLVGVDVEEGRPDVDVVYTWSTETTPAQDGARVFGPSTGSEILAWVYPGALYDELDSQGLLLPAGETEPDKDHGGS
ncbi:MAG: hypothetical protein NVV57_11830 [Demequina sp.]|nr:hypothetical protein [Demequina sp.]